MKISYSVVGELWFLSPVRSWDSRVRISTVHARAEDEYRELVGWAQHTTLGHGQGSFLLTYKAALIVVVGLHSSASSLLLDHTRQHRCYCHWLHPSVSTSLSLGHTRRRHRWNIFVDDGSCFFFAVRRWN